MKNMRVYTVDYSLYSFKAEDEFGDYYKGKHRNGWTNVYGYRCHHYWCTDGKNHDIAEHIAKWEYFNGKIPEGLEIDHIKTVKNGGTNKLSNLRIGTHKDNMNNTETKENISRSTKNHPLLSKQVHQFTLDGELIGVYPSTSEAARQTGFHQWAISACCNGGFFSKNRNKWVNMKKYKGYIWKYPL